MVEMVQGDLQCPSGHQRELSPCAAKAAPVRTRCTTACSSLRGYLRWQMTLHYKVWLVSTGRFTWEEVFETKPPEVPPGPPGRDHRAALYLERDHLARDV